MTALVFALIGFTAVVAQIVLMRELMVVFGGNEVSLGVMLASWLFWTALGSSVLGRLPARAPRRLMAALEVFAALALPATIAAVRASKGLFQTVPGELLAPGPMLLTSFVALSIFCALSGWLFAAGARLRGSLLQPADLPRATSTVYLFEAVGSGLGGLAASAILLRWLSAMEIAAVLASLNVVTAAILAFARPAAAIAAAVLSATVLPVVAPRLEQLSMEQLWRGFRLVGTRSSIYGSLAVIETEGSRTLYESGLAVFSAPDPAAAEEAVHYALLQHPEPRRLLLIGGGVNGSIAQALQHASLERIDYVELDPAIFEVARAYFPNEWAPIERDPRVRAWHDDGRHFLKYRRAEYDAIILNLPDPQTAQLNRFYTAEFFAEAAARLAPSGVLSLRLRGAENYISPELAAFLRCIHKTLRLVFPEVKAMPGETVHFFAAKRAGILAGDAQALVGRLRARRIQTQYVREYYIPFRMMPDRLRDLEAQIEPRPETPVNRDFAPVAYFFGAALWSGQFNQTYRAVFGALAGVPFTALLLALLALAAATQAAPSSPSRAAALCVAMMGFTLMGLEVLLLLGFQAVHGYVYYQLAIVIAGFMAGMALGAWRGMRRAASLRAVAALQTAAAAAPVALYAILQFAAFPIVFPALAVACGFLGGYQFPIASGVYFEKRPAGPGALYALDLTGACLGALLLSAYLIPVFGFARSALLLLTANLGPALLAARAKRG